MRARSRHKTYRILYINAAMADLAGITAEAAEGQELSAPTRDKSSDAIAAHIGRAPAAGPLTI
jgi:hypothetical protein